MGRTLDQLIRLFKKVTSTKKPRTTSSPIKLYISELVLEPAISTNLNTYSTKSIFVKEYDFLITNIALEKYDVFKD